MPGVEGSFEDQEVKLPCCSFAGYVTIFTFIPVFSFILSFSGCLGSDDGQPDEIPDLYQKNASSGDEVIQDDELSGSSNSAYLMVSSPEFENGVFIPDKYTCEGDNINPSIELDNFHEGTFSLLLIVDDTDAPSGTFTHLVVSDIDPATSSIGENSVPGIEGENSAGSTSYIGPCPFSDVRRYYFRIYALDSKIDIFEGSGRDSVESAMEGHVLGYGEMMGMYSR